MRNEPKLVVLVGSILVAGGAACLGNIGGSGSTDPLSGPNGSSPTASTTTLGKSPLRRLNRAEYESTVHELFGVDGSPAEGWPLDGTDSGFDDDVSGQGATADLIEQIMRSAEQVAGAALPLLGEKLPCAAQSGDDSACGDEFIARFGRRVYRRPLESEDELHLKSVFDWGLSHGDLATALRLTITAMLQSPYFLYRPEFGAPSPGDDAVGVPLGDYEIATRLSYLLVGSCPDDELLDAADAGELHTPEQIRAQAERLLDSAGGRKTINRFFHQWMPLDRLAKVDKSLEDFPEWNAELQAALAEDTKAFIEHVVFDSVEGSLAELFSAEYVYASAKTAALYGIEDSLGDTPERVTVGEPRAGILMQAGIMTALAGTHDSSPVARGKFVFQDLLCQSIGAPPANLPGAGVPPKPDPTLTTRERYAEHRDNPKCSVCHNFMDPLGFALENFDAMGRFRDTENGKPIDPTGEIPLEGQTVAFEGPLDLADYLATSELSRRCLARKWFTYAFGRTDLDDDKGTLDELEKPLDGGAASIREFILASTQSYAFTHRLAPDAEECTQ